MARPGPLGDVVAALAVAAVLLLGACAGPAQPTAPHPAASAAGAQPAAEAGAAAPLTALRRDGTLVEIRLEPPPGGSAAPAVDLDQAIATARERLGLVADTPVTAREALLTVRGLADGALRADRRWVWLLRFEGTAFVGDPCSCGETPTRPSTLVAVDPTDGAIVATLGV